MKLLYFAWVREKIGVPEEDIDLAPGIKTVAQLLDWLRSRGPAFEAALADDTRIRVAVNQDHVPLDFPVRQGDEVAIFPPVTGG